MKFLLKLFIILLIISFGTVNCPNLSIAQEESSENTKVTEHKPEGVVSTEKKPRKSKGWLWAIVGILAVVGGVAALGGGGGGGGGGSDSSDDAAPTGEYEFTW
jgi:hypothetical protein